MIIKFGVTEGNQYKGLWSPFVDSNVTQRIQILFNPSEEKKSEKKKKGSLKLLKSCKSFFFLNASQGLTFIDSSCMVKKTIGRVTFLNFLFKTCHW